ncbi:hypothetical protein [Burkholderia dolosa]|uniref:hypothetical protein n=1 Tax=Burkholderia dolosa TaxID=152500 RepID=UPI0027D25222|nr:hypothetical protein [Burkholderia dolosa]
MSNLNYGSTIHLQNMYDVANGDYLDRNNPIDDQEYYVVTTRSTDRDGSSGTWKIESAIGGQGPEVKIGDIVKLSNASAGGGYLCAIPYDSSLATIQAVTNRIASDESLQWEIVVPDGMKGDTLRETDIFYLKNSGQQAYLGVYYGPPSGTSNGLYGVWGYKSFAKETQQQWRYIDATPAPAPTPTPTTPTPTPTPTPTTPTPAPTPTPSGLRTGRKCCWDVPANTTVYVAAMNTEQWNRTVHVWIDGKEATPISLPAGNNGVVHVYETGKTPSSNGNNFCISIDDSKAGEMMLEWYPPVAVGKGLFVNIGAEKDYQKESGYSDVAVSVYWVR